MPNNNVTSLPYAKWLEKSLQELVKFPVKGICINATTTNGEVYTNYYNMSMLEKLTIAGVVQQDAMFDSMAANGVIEYADDEAEETNE